MWHLFQKLFRANPSVSIRRQARPRLESLESRNLLNAGPIVSATQFFGGGPAHVASFSGGSGSFGIDHGHGISANTTVLSATLTGATGTAGTATFTSNSTTGQNSLGVQVSDLAADTTFTVEAGTTTLGTVTTDANGSGLLTLTNPSATITTGTALTLLDPTGATVLSGTFALGTICQPGTALTAALTGATGTSGTVRFTTSTTAGQNGLDLHVSGLAANSTFTVDVGTTAVGTITTDANGHAHLDLTGLAATAAVGTAVTVLDSTGATVLSGSLAVGTVGTGGGHCH